MLTLPPSNGLVDHNDSSQCQEDALSARHKIAIISAYSTVPRSLRMARILVEANNVVHMIEWDRIGSKPRTEVKNGIVFKRLKLKAAYGLHAFYLFPIWIIFAFLQTIMGNYDMVQPQTLACMIPTFFVARFIRRAQVIYDLADFYKDAYVSGIPIISWISGFLERLLVRRADVLILASERQISQVKARNLPDKVVMFYNAPEINSSVETGNSSLGSNKERDSVSLLYPGSLGFDRLRPLMKVISAVKGLPVRISVAGFGEYESIVRNLSKTNEQLAFLGCLDNEKLMESMTRSDGILLTYDSRYANNRIGLPNKLFEAMACGSFILAPRNTYMGEFVAREKIGIVVDFDDPTEIEQAVCLMIGREKRSIQFLRRNARRLYFERFGSEKLNGIYLRAVESLSETEAFATKNSRGEYHRMTDKLGLMNNLLNWISSEISNLQEKLHIR